jgi:hypothetical protein
MDRDEFDAKFIFDEDLERLGCAEINGAENSEAIVEYMLRMSGKNIIKDVGYIVKNLRNQRR